MKNRIINLLKLIFLLEISSCSDFKNIDFKSKVSPDASQIAKDFRLGQLDFMDNLNQREFFVKMLEADVSGKTLASRFVNDFPAYKEKEISKFFKILNLGYRSESELSNRVFREIFNSAIENKKEHILKGAMSIVNTSYNFYPSMEGALSLAIFDLERMEKALEKKEVYQTLLSNVSILLFSYANDYFSILESSEGKKIESLIKENEEEFIKKYGKMIFEKLFSFNNSRCFDIIFRIFSTNMINIYLVDGNKLVDFVKSNPESRIPFYAMDVFSKELENDLKDEKCEEIRFDLINLVLKNDFIKHIVDNGTETEVFMVSEIIFTYLQEEKIINKLKKQYKNAFFSDNVKALANRLREYTFSFERYDLVRSIRSEKIKDIYSRNRGNFKYELTKQVVEKEKDILNLKDVINILENEITKSSISGFVQWVDIHPKERYQLSSIVCIETFYNLMFRIVKYGYSLALNEIAVTSKQENELSAKDVFKATKTKLAESLYLECDLVVGNKKCEEYSESIIGSVTSWLFGLFKNVHINKQLISCEVGTNDYGRKRLYASFFYYLGRCSLFSKKKSAIGAEWLKERDNKLKLLRNIQNINFAPQSFDNYLMSMDIVAWDEEELTEEEERNLDDLYKTYWDEDKDNEEYKKSLTTFYSETEEEREIKEKEVKKEKIEKEKEKEKEEEEENRRIIMETYLDF